MHAPNLERREFLQNTLIGVLATQLGMAPLQARAIRAPRILLRSSWQVVNIGDIAHTPGVLALIEKHIPANRLECMESRMGHFCQVTTRIC